MLLLRTTMSRIIVIITNYFAPVSNKSHIIVDGIKCNKRYFTGENNFGLVYTVGRMGAGAFGNDFYLGVDGARRLVRLFL